VAHCEDYSEPFSEAVTCKYPLCFTCHMMVHCRFKNAFAWQRYKRAIRSGARFAGLKTWPQFLSAFLGDDWPEPELIGSPPTRDVLSEIA
jgi:hypothetical protein